MKEHEQEQRDLDRIAQTHRERAENPFRSDANDLTDSVWRSVLKDMGP